MSHSTVLVTGLDYASALAPFDENTEVEPYVRYTKADLIARVRARNERVRVNCYEPWLADPEGYEAQCRNPRHLEYLRSEFADHLAWTDDQCYADATADAEPENLDADGGEISTYNPKSRWDWYQVGGRWDGGLVTTDGRKTNSCTRGELDLDRTPATFAVLHEGEWIERARMGWWGTTSDERFPKHDWPAKWREIVAALPPGTQLTLIDVHI